MKCKNCRSPLIPSAVMCDCGFHVIEQRMTEPTSASQREMRAAFTEGLRRARRAFIRNLCIAGALVGVSVGASVYAIETELFGKEAWMLPFFVLIAGVRVAMQTSMMHERRNRAMYLKRAGR